MRTLLVLVSFPLLAAGQARKADPPATDIRDLKLRDWEPRSMMVTKTTVVEKPLFHGCFEVPQNQFSGLYVGYNLRFHPLIARFREIAAAERILSAAVYVGQHLSTWRQRERLWHAVRSYSTPNPSSSPGSRDSTMI